MSGSSRRRKTEVAVTPAAAAATLDVAMAAADDALIEALRKDYDAWQHYRRTGRLPKCVCSKGMDHSAIRCSDNSWVEYFTAADCTRALASHADYTEYLHLGLDYPVRPEALLADVGDDTDQMGETRSAKYKCLQAAFHEYVSLHNKGKQAQQQQQPR